MDNVIEAVAVKLDLPPLNGLWRIVLGASLYPAYAALCRGSCPEWVFLVYILFVLLGLRVVPLLFRKLLNFSPEAQRIWDERRQLAKIYDSFQWRKLFWIGVGLWAYLLYARVKAEYPVYVAALFTIGGGIGLATWLFVRRKTKLASTGMMA